MLSAEGLCDHPGWNSYGSNVRPLAQGAGVLKGDQVKRLQELEAERARLRRRLGPDAGQHDPLDRLSIWSNSLRARS